MKEYNYTIIYKSKPQKTMKYTLNTKDFLRGLLVAVGTAVLVLLQQMLTTQPMVINWSQLGMAAGAAAVTYLLKNFFTDDVNKAKNTLKDAAADSYEARKVETIVTKAQMIILLIGLSCAANAQSFFKAVPKPSTFTGQGAVSMYPDAAPTTELAFRPIVNVGSYLIGSKENALLTGGGVSYQKLQYSSETGKWQSVWSINALAWGKVVVANQNNSPSFLYGLAVGALNNLILVGVATDGKKFFGTAGFGINLNN